MIEDSNRGPTFTREDVVAELNKQGVQVAMGEECAKPQPINMTGFEDLPSYGEREIEELIEEAIEYAAGPTITDSFLRHEARREWRHEMGKRFGHAFTKFYSHNRLRGNKIYSLRLGFQQTERELDQRKIETPEAGRLRQALRQFPDVSKYPEMNTQEKVAATKKISEACKKLVSLFAE